MLGLQGLGAFSTILATLSTDNIAPMAMIQLEKLGAQFHVSGKFAKQTPDLLQRHKTHTLGRLAATIGWRKGDSPSLLAETAGGQAAALLAVVLRNWFDSAQCGDVLFKLCSNLFGAHASVASIAQLAGVADLVASKMFAIGFPNFLAEQAVRIGSAFDHLQVPQPPGLYESLTTDSVSDLLYSISQALREEATILRISGAAGIGEITGLALFLFPLNTMVNVNGVTIHEGPNPKLILELRHDCTTPAVISLEQKILFNNSGSSRFTIECYPTRFQSSDLRFHWDGWLASALDLTFACYGLQCTAVDRRLFADLLVSIGQQKTPIKFGGEEDPSEKYMEYLGEKYFCFADYLTPYSWERMSEICKKVLCVMPTNNLPLHELLDNFSNSMQRQVVVKKLCDCHLKAPCSFADALFTEDSPLDLGYRSCRVRRMADYLCRLLEAGIGCFFVSAGVNATVALTAQIPRSGLIRSIMRWAMNKAPCGMTKSLIRFYHPYGLASTLQQGSKRGYAENTVLRSEGSTMYLEVLDSFVIPNGQIGISRLVDGHITFRGHYFNEVFDYAELARERASHSIARSAGVIPSNIGAHTDLLVTLRETLEDLELKTTVRSAGQNLDVRLSSSLRGFSALRRTAPCSHPSNTPLTEANAAKSMATSVISPLAEKSPEGPRKFSIVMTKGNPAAQILACDGEFRALLMEECCLNCAIEQAEEIGLKVIIVS